ncbi:MULTISPECIES: alpha/beta fold hydrolase [Gordonia]|jgi:pimeloyl-ACP methyl ester carboxylesterase|uniref:alpha/beta fold hydrolase n=1 Tax=Gordonia TaxID=2053 RepID=UPI0005A9FF0F|nr:MULTISPECIES: alpha/beta hydrolase [Gordonia]MDH3008405.1 alpha/beta hydrolase [Gordonia alkanivorans]MDH3013885.1 alpha/beta hydrolase [Gordonia alkanivorans]MDH3015665.1 alpha/beta hydrolase [Gordonia alkanivorans]MDH3022673.1 alpha/beta hydrolase [Gordonia alkanivorans]MDH3027110.1 alpha/beta hydrolase [Gordonia alkanivorans]
MTTVQIGDITVAYAEAGSGESDSTPIILVHGLAEDSRSWADTQQELAEFHTFAYDLRGHGSTTPGNGEGSLEQLGRDLIGFIEQVTGPAIVVGFSLGGTIALWAAAERPDLVTRPIVLGTSSVVGRSATEFYAHRIGQASDTSTSEFREAIRDDTAAAIVAAHDRLDEITEIRLDAIGAGAGYINAARAMAALRENPLTPRLAEVRQHVEVIGADGDTFCPEKAARMIIDALGDVTYREVPNAGHLMNVDNPAAVATVLRAAIRGDE